ncbi:hypothetical protein BDF22DRAFT_690422 [Syncephalis plumigaleata]|nr:hypothetical protein BDF22DRAFT_690422 [Syncephalis plumigaleata]
MTSQQSVKLQSQSVFSEEQNIALEQQSTQTETKPYFGEQILTQSVQIPYDLSFGDSFLHSTQLPSFSLLNTEQMARPDNVHLRDEDSIGDIADDMDDILPDHPMTSWMVDTSAFTQLPSELDAPNEEQDPNTNPMYVKSNSILKKTPVSKQAWLKVKKQRDLERVAEKFKHLPPQSPFNIRRPLQITKLLHDDTPVIGGVDLERVVTDGANLPEELEQDNNENTNVDDININDSQHSNGSQHNSSRTALNTTDDNVPNMVESSWHSCRKGGIIKKSTGSTDAKKPNARLNGPSGKRMVEMNDSQYLDSQTNDDNVKSRKRKQSHQSDMKYTTTMPAILYDSEDSDASLNNNEEEQEKEEEHDRERSFILGSSNVSDEADDSITADTIQQTTKSTNNENNMDEEKLMTLRIIRRLRDETNVTGREVLDALVSCSGHVGLTRKYLQQGQEACKKYAWTMEEDHILTSSSGRDAQRGIDNVHHRIVFLELLTQSLNRVK